MQALLEHFILQSALYSLIAVLLACLACGHYRLLIGGLDLFLAGLAL